MNTLAKILTGIVLAGTLTGCRTGYNYPAAAKVDQVDFYHGQPVADPYRWLENDIRDSQEVSSWIDAQNKITRKYLDNIPERNSFHDRLAASWDYDKIGLPARHGQYYIQSIRHSMDDHSTVYKMKELGGEREILFNPTQWSTDGSVTLADMSFSEDGRFVAYGIQTSGSDWRQWRIRQVDTGTDLPDTLNNLKFTSPQWDTSGSGFYYGKYPDPEENAKFTSPNLDMKLMYHKLGDDQADDSVIYYDPQHSDWGYYAQVTNDGKYLLLYVSAKNCDKSKVMIKELNKPDAQFSDLVPEFVSDFSLIENDDNILYMVTDHDAPRRRIIAIDVNNRDSSHWHEIVPECDAVIESVNLFGNTLICRYLSNVTSAVKAFALDGSFLHEIELPGLGTASGFAGKRREEQTFYSFQSCTMPPSIYSYDIKTNSSQLIDRVKVAFDPEEYVTRQIFFTSKDGTRVPMFISHKKDIKLDGTNPTIMYGYGGFSISLRGGFSTSRQVWLEQGGIWVTVNLRGGGEFGESWHNAGQKLNKQNVFDDFFAAAEYLIANNYTSPQHLGIMGGSNGGLLVAACMTQRPELFAAAIPEVGVLDMLRYDNFTAGRFWVSEYGSASESPEMFRYLLGYSPYHNIRPNVDYPATMVMTADTDDRVVPGHSFKFTARLQEHYQGTKPMLIRVQHKAGHGSGKPTRIILQEQADIYAFFWNNLK